MSAAVNNGGTGIVAIEIDAAAPQFGRVDGGPRQEPSGASRHRHSRNQRQNDRVFTGEIEEDDDRGDGRPRGGTKCCAHSDQA